MMSPALRIGATGFGLIAVCYGFARFAFGLFLPQIDTDPSLGPSLSGVISGGSFAGHCVAIVASAALTERIGARAVATAAAIVAALGMAGIALAPSPLFLAAAVMVASTALWSFGGQLVSQRLGWGPAGTGILWSCIGIGGIAGAWAGTFVNRFGLDCVHWAFLGLMAGSILAVGSGIAIPALALIGGAQFGAAYVMLAGVYLIWGCALSDRPATGLMIGFLTMAVGQTAAGGPIFGLLMAGCLRPAAVSPSPTFVRGAA